MGYELVERRNETLAFTLDGQRIGSFDRWGGANRGTIYGRIVSRNFQGWIDALEERFS